MCVCLLSFVRTVEYLRTENKSSTVIEMYLKVRLQLYEFERRASKQVMYL